MSQPSQAILAPCDNAENISNNNYESDIEVPEEVCSHIDQNFNEDHDTTKFWIRSACPNEYQNKRPPEYLKSYHCNLNVSNTSSRIKYPLNFVFSYNNLSPSYTYFVMSISSHVKWCEFILDCHIYLGVSLLNYDFD